MKFIKKNLFSLIAALLVVVAMLVAFAPFVVGKASALGISAETKFNGFVMMFGGKGTGTTNVGLSGNPETKLVVVDLIAFILMVVGLLATVVNMLLDTKFRKIIAFVGMGALVAAGVLLFFSLTGFFAANEVPEAAQDPYSLGAGAIIDAIILIVAGAVEALDMFKVIKIK